MDFLLKYVSSAGDSKPAPRPPRPPPPSDALGGNFSNNFSAASLRPINPAHVSRKGICSVCRIGKLVNGICNHCGTLNEAMIEERMKKVEFQQQTLAHRKRYKEMKDIKFQPEQSDFGNFYLKEREREREN